MVILGIWDGLDAGAALVIDGALVAVEHEASYARAVGTRCFPWTSIDMVLEAAGLRNADVDTVAVAGKFTPPLIARRHPWLRPLLKPHAFSPILDLEVLVQAGLRHTGVGAADADRAAEWLEGRLRNRGFTMRRVHMVDIHRALAAAAYRTQPDDDVLGLTLHPLGDGLSAAVHHCNAGQIDRAWAQQGFSALHVHLQRCAEVIGLQPLVDDAIFWGLAGQGTPDPDLRLLLDRTLRADGPRLTPRSYPMPSGRRDPLYKALGKADPATAAATVLANLIDVVTEQVRHHVHEQKISDVVVAGEVFDNARLVGALLELPEVTTVWVDPNPGYAMLPVGAALSIGGVAPARLPIALGRSWSDEQLHRALGGQGLQPVRPPELVGAMVDALVAGECVGRFHGRSGLGASGLGSRSVLVRADDVEAVANARQMLDRSPREDVVLAWVEGPGEGTLPNLAKAREASRFGAVAFEATAEFRERYPAGITPDGKVRLQRVEAAADPELHAVICELRRRTGCGGLVVLPLGIGREPACAVPGDALRVFQRAGLPALSLGPFWVRRAAAHRRVS